MRIAIAGAGDVSKYLVEEFLKVSYDVVVLSRSRRDWFVRPDISLRTTDYSVDSLVSNLGDCDGIISATQDMSMANVDLHLAILEACKRTKSCKRFIPSEYIGNVDDFPDQPAFYAANHQPIRDALARQDDIEWTSVNPGWLADYLVPSKYRYLRDIGQCHPVDLVGRTMVIPGTGDEPITCTAVRDMAAAIARIFGSPYRWPRATYLSGQATSWNEVKTLLQEEGHELDVTYRSVASLNATVAESNVEDEVLIAEFGLWSTSGSTRVPKMKAAGHKERFFREVHFRDVRQLFDSTKVFMDKAI